MSELSAAEMRVLKTLKMYGPMWNGDLGIETKLAWNSRVFARLARRKLIVGHPMRITTSGRAALKASGRGQG